MALKDEDYAKALEEKRKRQVEEIQKIYVKQQMEKQMAALQNPHHQPTAGTGTVHISHGGTTTTFTNSGTYIAGGGGGGGGVWGAGTGTGTGTGATLNSMAHPIGLKVITEENLQHDAMKAPLSALVDMWTVRWQGDWVNEGAFDEDDFWRLALVRLLGANKLEKHNLANQHRYVYRIIE